MTDGGSRLSSLAHEHLSPADADTFLRLARPAISLRHTQPEIDTVSHLGGEARLAKDQDWPTRLEEPLSLIAVLDLAELAGFASDLALPRQGILNLFYDADEQPWGFDPSDVGGWRVILADPVIAVDRPARSTPRGSLTSDSSRSRSYPPQDGRRTPYPNSTDGTTTLSLRCARP